MELIHNLWDITTQRLGLVVLTETLAEVLVAEFFPYTGGLIPRLLSILQEERTKFIVGLQIKAVTCLTSFGLALEQHLSLVIPVIITCYQDGRSSVVLRKQAIQSIAELSKSIDLYPYTSRFVHSLITVLSDLDESLQKACLDALYILAHTLGNSFVIFVPTLLKVRFLCLVLSPSP